MSAPHLNSSPASLPTTSKWVKGLTSEMPLSEALPQILKQRWDAVVNAVPDAAERGQHDPENVHRLRVACRRMDAVLKMFDRAIPKKGRNCTGKLLGKIRRKCGEARDLDVQLQFLGKLLPHVTPEATPGVGVIREQLYRRRNKIQAKLRERLDSMKDKFERCERRLFEAAQSDRHSARLSESFGAACVKSLRPEIEAICASSSDENIAPRALHQLRVRCKKLRYGSEIFSQILHESFRDELYPQLQKVQDVLGSWNDAVVTEAELSRLKQKWKRRRNEEGHCDLPWDGKIAWRDLQAGFAAAQHACQRQAETALLEFNRVWPDFVSKSFCQPVLDLLTSVEERAAVPEEPQPKKHKRRSRSRVPVAAE